MGDRDGWFVGERVQVTCRESKHYRRYGTVTKVHRVRLEVKFEDEGPGMYVDKIRASPAPLRRIRPNRRNTPSSPNERVVIEASPMQHDNNDVSELTRILEHLAFTAASLILSEADDNERTRAQDAFQASVRNNIQMLSDARNNDTRN
jgi:hypothetical protein